MNYGTGFTKATKKSIQTLRFREGRKKSMYYLLSVDVSVSSIVTRYINILALTYLDIH